MEGKTRPVLSLLVGTVLALASAEALLWVLAGSSGTEERVAVASGAPAILCVGDSNTYGVHLESEDSYPGQLQALLDASGEQFSVVNQGCPGLNTTQVRRGLELAIEDVNPVAVVVFAGVNDRWSNASKPIIAGAEPSLASALLAKSRLMKLVRLVDSRESSEDATTFEWVRGERTPTEHFPRGPAKSGPNRSRNKPSEKTRASIGENLEKIAAICRERGTAVVFVCYANFTEGVRQDVNAAIRDTARDLNVPLVDLEDQFRELVQTLPSILYIPQDSHLSAIGNHESARLVMLALRDAGVVVADPPPPSLLEAYGELELEELPGDDGPALELTGPPGWRWQLKLFRRYAGPQYPGGEYRVLQKLNETGLPKEEFVHWRGRFSESGSAATRLQVPQFPDRETFSGWEVRALSFAPDYTATMRKPGDTRGLRFSPLLELAP